MPSPTSYTSSRGIHCLDSGPDCGSTAVVLIHGLGGDAKFWTQTQAMLASRFRVLAVDLRGSGRSAGIAAPCLIDDLAADLWMLLDELNVSTAQVVGFSMGGLVAQAMAIEAPARVSRLALVATFATVNPQVRQFFAALGRLFASGASSAQMYDLILPWLFSEMFFADDRCQPHLVYARDPTSLQTPDDWLRLLDAMLRWDGSIRLRDLRMPTLILSGNEDRLAPPSDGAALQRCIPHAALRVTKGAHLTPIESTDAFHEHIMAFLTTGVAVGQDAAHGEPS